MNAEDYKRAIRNDCNNDKELINKTCKKLLNLYKGTPTSKLAEQLMRERREVLTELLNEL